MKYYSFVVLLVLILFASSNSYSRDITTFSTNIPEYLPEELEIELALSAGPHAIRENATVLVLTESGYKTAREGSNGFLCLVVRGNARFPDIIAPICYDEVGAKSLAKVTIDRQNFQKQGMTPQEVQLQIASGFQSGYYPTPEKAGIMYMLSPVLYVPDPENRGSMFTYIPHYMMYTPNMDVKQLGFEAPETRTKEHMFSGLPFVNGSGPHTLLVIPVGEKERMHIADEHKDLIKKMKEFIPLDVK